MRCRMNGSARERELLVDVGLQERSWGNRVHGAHQRCTSCVRDMYSTYSIGIRHLHLVYGTTPVLNCPFFCLHFYYSRLSFH